MITTVTGLIFVVVIFAAVLFVARRILRLAIKLALIGAVVFALFAGGIFGWWRGWFDSSPRTQRPVTQTNQTRNSNRRPSR
jgi:heme A synthase